MDKIALKIIVAGRTYPLTIKKEEEEAKKEMDFVSMKENFQIIDRPHILGNIDVLSLDTFQQSKNPDAKPKYGFALEPVLVLKMDFQSIYNFMER